jgi:hypothetical protein
MQRHIVYLDKLDPKENEPYPLLLEEYKLIQGKIDKLGEDKFKVRSWCFTLLTGGAVATNLLDNSSFTPLILIWAFAAVLAFHFIELRQRQIGKRLGYRAAAIEWSWQNSVSSKIATPQMARYLIRAARIEDSPYKITTALQSLNAELYQDCNASPSASTANARNFGYKKRLGKYDDPQFKWIRYLTVNSEDIFYFVQYGLIITFASFFMWGAESHKKQVHKQGNEAPEIRENSAELNIDGVKPTNLDEGK